MGSVGRGGGAWGVVYEVVRGCGIWSGCWEDMKSARE